MENAKADKYVLCEQRGISPADPLYPKVVQYAGVTGWLSSQFEEKTHTPVSPEGHALLADTLIIGPYIDHETERGGMPFWTETFEPLTFKNIPKSSVVHPNPFWKSIPNRLIQSLAGNINNLPEQRQEQLNFSWDAMLVSMFGHQEAVLGDVDVSEIIGARVLEAVSMSELFCSILFEDYRDYHFPFFRDWLALQFSAGNLIDSVFDYRQDIVSGHRELSLAEKCMYISSTLSLCAKYLKDPMTSRSDRRMMIAKLAAVYRGSKY